MKPVPIALTIAGSDSGGGAGIQADLKTFHRLHVYGCSVITCLTAQNTQGVRGVHAAPGEFVALQLKTVLDDLKVAAAKTGMLYNREIIAAVAEELARHNLHYLVVDPVVVATSGDALLEEDGLTAYKEYLFPRASLLTPNLQEAALLTGRQLESLQDMQEAALELAEYGCQSVLIKGGHLEKERGTDLLYHNGAFERLESPEPFEGMEYHGSGCTFAAAVTALLALGEELPAACRKAKQYVWQGLRGAWQAGKGAAVLDHWA